MIVKPRGRTTRPHYDAGCWRDYTKLRRPKKGTQLYGHQIVAVNILKANFNVNSAAEGTTQLRPFP